MDAAALKIGSQVIKQAPKVTKFKKFNTLQKILSKVKSSKNVIQKKLNTKQNLAKIGEGLKDLKNINQIRKLNKAVSTSTSAARKTPIGQSIAKAENFKALNASLRNYLGDSPQALIRNLAKAKGLRGKLFAGSRFIGPVFEILKLGDMTGQMLQKEYKEPIEGGPDNSIRNNLVNMTTNLKHISNRDKYKRTKLAGEADVIARKPFTGNKWNPFDDEKVLIPNTAKRHNLRADRLAKWDAREKLKIKEAK